MYENSEASEKTKITYRNAKSWGNGEKKGHHRRQQIKGAGGRVPKNSKRWNEYIAEQLGEEDKQRHHENGTRLMHYLYMVFLRVKFLIKQRMPNNKRT